jgi:hypothetical protein
MNKEFECVMVDLVDLVVVGCFPVIFCAAKWTWRAGWL